MDQYDTSSESYKKYTRSGENLAITDEEKETLRNFMFANLDPYRLVFQSDTDTCYIPLPSEKPFSTLCFQVAMGECPEMNDDPTISIQDYFKWQIEEIDLPTQSGR